MTGNSLGVIFKITTWGESHGGSIGGVVDGVPSGIEISESYIQHYLDKRRPGASKLVSQRKEEDKIEILSGIFEGKTTGAPIAMIIHNQDAKPSDYADIKSKFRPGHADYAYSQKYGLRDYRGGGRASGRETAMRVAAGAIARKILPSNMVFRSAILKIGKQCADGTNIDWDVAGSNPLCCPDPELIGIWQDYLLDIRKQGNSVGAVIVTEVVAPPAGLGEPVFDKLDAEIAKAIMSIGAVKGVEIGLGFAAANMYGDQFSDKMHMNKGKAEFLSNNAGGILGGISTGETISIKYCVKPTSSILLPQQTIDTEGNNVQIQTKGRHDPCVGIRVVPVGEAMLACVLADYFLLQKRFK
jgi:chorismate synthase